jgi:integrase
MIMSPKSAKELTAIQVKRLTKPSRHAVGGVPGLHLYVSQSGARSWVLRVTVGSKRRDIGLGGYPEVSLKLAKETAIKYRQMIRDGIDPIIERKAAKAALISAQEKGITFQDAAVRCHAAKSPEFRNEKHRKDWISSLERFAYPIIGKLPIADIELPHIMQVLKPIWHEKTETATRVRQRLETVLTWAAVSGFRKGENPARWAGNLKEVLAAPSKIIKTQHYRALPWQEIGKFMPKLRSKEGIAARALEFSILTAARSGEVRGMTWNEIDLDEKLWTVPEDRIKAGRAHKVPLSQDVIKLLKSTPQFYESEYVFSAPRGGKLSDMALAAVLRRMNVDAVPHGFRSTFKDWARSCTAYPDEVSELALAHVSNDATRAAYARDELLPKRARLMRDWAKFCNTIPTKAKVTPIRKRRSK